MKRLNAFVVIINISKIIKALQYKVRRIVQQACPANGCLLFLKTFRTFRHRADLLPGVFHNKDPHHILHIHLKWAAIF